MPCPSSSSPAHCCLRRGTLILRHRRRSASGARPSFRGRNLPLLVATALALKRTLAARHRLQARIARDDKRVWVVKRRERTRQLIELGGLVAKAGLVELTGDDRAVILGLLVEGAAILRSERGEEALTLWRRRGRRAFEQGSEVD